ncbi:MAG: hypothetical protein GEV06_01350 [Luteitalea sp.]|nr:hypothetical protein [Luteitalea sp.]
MVRGLTTRPHSLTQPLPGHSPSPCHPLTLSPPHPVTPSPRHPVTLSPSHPNRLPPEASGLLRR